MQLQIVSMLWNILLDPVYNTIMYICVSSYSNDYYACSTVRTCLYDVHKQMIVWTIYPLPMSYKNIFP